MTDKTIMNPCIECGGNCCRAQIEGISCSSMFYEPRPHGEWIPCEDDNFCKCSECKQIMMSEERSNYCPNCGSDNRKKGETE